MGIGDLFKAKENEQLKQRIAYLESLMTPEMRDVTTLHDEIEKSKSELINNAAELNKLKMQVMTAQAQLADAQARLQAAESKIIVTNEAALLQEFGLYEPMFDFAHSEQYKARLDQIRQQQKDLIKAGLAASGNMNWTVNNNLAQGRKMVSDMQKLLLRAFNSECDEVVSKVKFNNVEASEKRITSSRDAISKLGSIMGVAITDPYYRSKITELRLAYEYQVKKKEEQEEQKRIRAELREQEKLQKEIAAKRAEIEKEQKHYINALKAVAKQMETASEEEKAALVEKMNDINLNLDRLDAAEKDVDYREANQRAGYVYIISNIGAFGEGVYKIGMTRRLDPTERIDELGDASVPFDFDIHAMIFTKDAPGLEAALHKAFDDRKVNMVNTRREFFRVSLDEIKEVVRKNFDSTVDFVDVPEAEQYRQTLLMRGQKE